MKKYVIIGVDGLLNDICDVIHALGHQVSAVFQNMPERRVAKTLTISERIELLGYPVELHTSLDDFSFNPELHYIQALNSPHKYKMVEQLKADYDIKFDSLIHPLAHIGSNVTIGEGVFVNALTSIAPNAHIDDFCSINRSAAIGHDAYIGKYTRIGPRVALAGSTIIGSHCSISISATVIDCVEIGDWSEIGAGSIVNKNIPLGKVAAGMPARVIESNNRMPAD